MRTVLLSALFVALLSSAAPSEAQAPPALPASLHAAVGLPGSGAPRFANATLDLGSAEWAVVGCIASVANVCLATQRVVLTTEQRTRFVRLWMEVASMPRCEPAGFSPGDPEYTLATPAAAYQGHLPRAAEDLAVRTSGPCLADARLALWLAQLLGG